MAGRGRECACWLASIPFVVAALVFLGALIGLAIASIISSQVDDSRYLDAVDDPEDNLNSLWALFMAGSSVAIVPYSVFGTVAIAFLVEAVKATRARKRGKAKAATKAASKPGDSQDVVVRNGHTEGIIDVISGEPLYHFNGAELASISVPAMILVFISLATSAMSISGILWAIAIAYNNARVVDKNVTVYLVVEALVGLVVPILAIISASLFSVFLEYVTQGSLDARVFITRLLPVVKLVKGAQRQYWVIEKRFYFEIKKLDVFSRQDDDDSDSDDTDSDDDPPSVPCNKYCSRTGATWILAIIVSLAFLLSISYFMNENITEQVTVRTCPHSSIETDCFNRSTFNFINCSDPEMGNTTFELLHCFRFLRFGRDSDVIGGVSRSFAFYLATLAFFTTAFHVANVLINFIPTRLWGLGFVVVGVVMIGVGLIVMLTREAVLLQLDIIQVFQVYMVAVFILLIGLLLLIGKWWESVGESGKGKTKGKCKPGSVELERFTGIGTTKGEVKKTKHELDHRV